jgi:hypothetical protein
MQGYNLPFKYMTFLYLNNDNNNNNNNEHKIVIGSYRGYILQKNSKHQCFLLGYAIKCSTLRATLPPNAAQQY